MILYLYRKEQTELREKVQTPSFLFEEDDKMWKNVIEVWYIDTWNKERGWEKGGNERERRDKCLIFSHLRKRIEK